MKKLLWEIAILLVVLGVLCYLASVALF